MANYIQFFKITDGVPAKEPSVLNDIDAEIAGLYGEEPHERYYYCSWFDMIAGPLAYGRTYAEVRESLIKNAKEDEEAGMDAQRWHRRAEICDHLSQNYSTSAWATIGK